MLEEEGGRVRAVEGVAAWGTPLRALARRPQGASIEPAPARPRRPAARRPPRRHTMAAPAGDDPLSALALEDEVGVEDGVRWGMVGGEPAPARPPPPPRQSTRAPSPLPQAGSTPRPASNGGSVAAVAAEVSERWRGRHAR